VAIVNSVSPFRLGFYPTLTCYTLDSMDPEFSWLIDFVANIPASLLPAGGSFVKRVRWSLEQYPQRRAA
jgi:hypothetical protein